MPYAGIERRIDSYRMVPPLEDAKNTPPSVSGVFIKEASAGKPVPLAYSE